MHLDEQMKPLLFGIMLLVYQFIYILDFSQ